MIRFDLEKERARIDGMLPLGQCGRGGAPHADARDLDSFLDNVTTFFRTVRRIDEQNHLAACETDRGEFDAADQQIVAALGCFLRWAKIGVEAADAAAEAGCTTEYIETLRLYAREAGDMLCGEPAFLSDEHLHGCFCDACRRIAEGAVEDIEHE